MTSSATIWGAALQSAATLLAGSAGGARWGLSYALKPPAPSGLQPSDGMLRSRRRARAKAGAGWWAPKLDDVGARGVAQWPGTQPCVVSGKKLR
jgi:hypothetical protein